MEMKLGERLNNTQWIRNQAEKEAKKDVLPFPERVGQLVGIGILIIVIVFFIIHQTRPTGFFTEGFGDFGAVLLFVLLVLGMFAPLARAFFGRKNLARPIDAFVTAVSVVGAIYFLARFTFDFSHFADPLPGALEFLLSWISATFAKFILVIGIVTGPVFVVYHTIMYFAVKDRLSEPVVVPPAP